MSHLNRGLEILKREGPLFMKLLSKNPIEAVKKHPSVFTFSLLASLLVMVLVYLLFSRSSSEKETFEKEEKSGEPEDDDDKTVQGADENE